MAITPVKWNELSNVPNIGSRQDIKDAINGVVSELNDASLNSSVVAAASALTAADSGKTIFLNSATGFATTLPAPAAGLTFKFVVTTAPTSGNHTIVTNGSANIIEGNSFPSPAAAGAPAVNEDSINLIANQAVIGDNVELVSDGTSWFVNAYVRVAAGVTFTAA